MARLIKRGKYWSVVFDEEGRRQVWRSTGQTNRHEAEKMLASEMVRRSRSLIKDIKKISFKQLALKWLELHEMDKKQKTISSYTEQVNKHLIPSFGHLNANSISAEAIEQFKQESAKTVSATTVNYNLRLLRSILDTGIQWGYLPENPAKKVKRLKQNRKQPQPLTKEQVTKLLDRCNEKYKPILMTAILTGLRMGEVICMRWKNLDWKNETYSVTENYSAGVVSIPKTETSYRKVHLPKILVETLKKHKIVQNKQIIKMPGKWENQGLIFPSEAGTYLHANNLRRRVFYPALKEAGLPRIRFHDLRGTFATLLLQAHPNPKTVQEALGHKTARITLELYAQVNDQLRHQAAGELESFIYAGANRSKSVANGNSSKRLKSIKPA